MPSLICGAIASCLGLLCSCLQEENTQWNNKGSTLIQERLKWMNNIIGTIFESFTYDIQSKMFLTCQFLLLLHWKKKSQTFWVHHQITEKNLWIFSIKSGPTSLDLKGAILNSLMHPKTISAIGCSAGFKKNTFWLKMTFRSVSRSSRLKIRASASRGTQTHRKAVRNNIYSTLKYS